MTPSNGPCPKSRRLVGDPIDVVTGANTDVTADFTLPGPIPLAWKRYYSSARNTVACSLGWGHSHEYERTLQRDLDGLHYTDPLGIVVEFPDLLNDGDEASQEGLLLRRLTAQLYEIEQDDETSMEFELSSSQASARLTRLRDGDITIEFRYLPTGPLQEIVDSQGRSLRVATDKAGRILGLFLADPADGGKERALMVYEYDTAGNLGSGQDLYKNTFRFTWDQHNRMLRRTDRRGYSFHFTYDDLGRCVHSRGDDGLFEVFLDYQPDVKATFVRRGDGGVWTYFFDEAGTLTQINDPCGGVAKFTLDDESRVTEEIDPNGNVTQLVYNELGENECRIHPLGYELPPYEVEPEPDDPLAYELPATPLEWEFGHLVNPDTITVPQRDDPLLNQFPAQVFNSFLEYTNTYDASGPNVNGPNPSSSSPGGQAPNPSTAMVQGELQTDLLGQPILRQGPIHAERWRYDPNGNLVEYHDREGKVWRFNYGSFNLLQEEIDPLGHPTRFAYSAQEKITRAIDAGGTTHEFKYDQKDRLIEVHYQGKLQESYRFDKADNVVEKKDAKGRTLLTWEIGPGNLDMVRHLAGGEKHTLKYDEAGRIAAAATPHGTVTCSYDEDGRLLEDQRDGKGVIHEIELEQVVATTYFDNFEVTYGIDDNGDLVIIDPTDAEHRVSLSANGLILRQLANGTRELAWFDAEGICRRKSSMSAANPSPWMRSYFYSPEGNLRTAADSQAGGVQYRYDDAERLAEAKPDHGPVQSYAFDAAGNLLRQPGLQNVQVVAGNQVQQANGDRFTYNERGQLSSRQGPNQVVQYRYNELDMLVEVEINGQVWSAAYDAFCRRISKTWQGRTTTYYWDDFRLAAEVRHDGSARLYVYSDHAALVPFMFVEYASLEAEPESGQRYYLFTNQVGAPIRVENDTGQTVWSARIDPYGRAEISPDSFIDMPLRFPGHYHDAEIGLHYNRFRYYSPELGRYLQQDPLGIEGGINLYAYVDNPLIDVDIDGLAKSPAPGKCKNKPPKKKPPKKKTNQKQKSSKKPPAKKPKQPKPPKGGYVKEFETGKFKDLAKRAKKGDGLTPDHIPSNAANLAAALAAKKKKHGPNAKLTKKEKKDIRDNGNCIMVKDKLHKKGRTHGGKNTKKQIAQDAKNRKQAAAKDKAAHQKNVPAKDKKALDKGLKDLDKANGHSKPKPKPPPPKPKPKPKAKGKGKK
jgi:RHS repeat-associated protein